MTYSEMTKYKELLTPSASISSRRCVNRAHVSRHRTQNAGALLDDWPRIPLPTTSAKLSPSAALGRRLAVLLDPESTINYSGEWSFLARLVVPQPADLAEHLKINGGWGSRGQGSTVMPGRGLATPRPWTEGEREKLNALARQNGLLLEDLLALIGETCLDIYLNGATFWSAVPANVWGYNLGGYQVLKKWLSYREFAVLERSLHAEEAQWFAQVTRRIAAILLLGPALNASYNTLLLVAAGF